MIKRDLYYERIPTKSLREDVRLLGNILGNVIKKQEGQTFYNLVEKIRKLSKANRANIKQKDSYKKISKKKKFDLIIDIQGDEPLVSPYHIDAVINHHLKNLAFHLQMKFFFLNQ